MAIEPFNPANASPEQVADYEAYLDRHGLTADERKGHAMNKVTVEIAGHGTYSAGSLAVDVMISRYLPNSPVGLRAVLTEQTGEDWSDVDSVTDALVVLAYLYEGAMHG